MKRNAGLWGLCLLTLMLSGCNYIFKSEAKPAKASRMQWLETTRIQIGATEATTALTESEAEPAKASWMQWLETTRIQIGATSATAALTELQQDPLVVNAIQHPSGQLTWQWANGPGQAVATYETKGWQALTYVQFSGVPLTLGEVLAAYGPPSHVHTYSVIGFTGKRVYNLGFLYIEQGLFVVMPSSATPPTLHPDLEVAFVRAHAPNALELYNLFECSQLWQGWLPYEDYAQANTRGRCR